LHSDSFPFLVLVKPAEGAYKKILGNTARWIACAFRFIVWGSIRLFLVSISLSDAPTVLICSSYCSVQFLLFLDFLTEVSWQQV